MKKLPIYLAGGLLVIAVLLSCLYRVREGEQIILTQFGRVVKSVQDPGLHFKLPILQSVSRFEKRILEWDGPPIQVVSKDKVYLQVDYFARWRITDINTWYVAFADERRAESRITDVLDSNTRAVCGQNNLIELIRSSKDRKLALDAPVDPESQRSNTQQGFLVIENGRKAIENKIIQLARASLLENGIELLDIRFKRLNYDMGSQRKIVDRMISERTQIAERYRSEGAAIAARVQGDRERDLQRITSEAYKKVQEIEGTADAKAAEIYSKAFGQSPDSAEFYGFIKTLETYEKSLPEGSTLMLSTDAEIYRYLKDSKKPTVP